MAKKLKSECFDIFNTNGKAVLFRTDDVSVNKLTFSIINLTGETLSLTGGKPVKQAGTGEGGAGSSFNFNFESMLTAEVVQDLKITLPADWASAFFAESNTAPPSWSVAPVNNITIPVNGTVKIGIENIKCNTTKPGNFEILYRNIPGYPDNAFPIAKHLDILKMPDPQKKTLPLKEGYINPDHPIGGQSLKISEAFDPKKTEVISGSEAVPVYITYDPGALIQNGFTYIVTNTSTDPLVPAALEESFVENTGNADEPAVYISFLFGEEDYAITSQVLADNSITINIESKLPWVPMKHVGGTAYWQFLPESKQIMQGLETIRFPIEKIITQLNVAWDDISVMYIQFNNIPGYNDAVYTQQLQKKKAKASMVSLEVDKRNINIGEDVKISWVSALAKRVTISYKTRDDKTILLDSAAGDIKLNGTAFALPTPPSADVTVLIATAYDDSNTISTQDKTITVNQQPASIKSIKADPPLADVTSKADVTLNWEAANAQKLVLTTPTGDVTVTGTSSYTFRGLQSAFTFTLTAWSYYRKLPETVQLSVKVLAYKTEPPVPLPLAADRIQPMQSVFINQQHGRVYVINAGNNTVYDIDAKKPAIGKTYPGNVITLSRGGEKLVVFNPQERVGVRLYDVASGARSLLYDVGFQVVGNYPGTAMLINPDITRFYWCVVLKMGTLFSNVQLFTIDARGNTMTYARGCTMVIDIHIKAIAFNYDNTKIYVAHDVLLQIQSLTDNNWSKEIYYGKLMPTLFVCKKAAPKLYLACDGGNCIKVIDTQKDEIIKTITLSNKPVNMVISPDDKRLYVSVYDTSLLVVIDTETDDILFNYTVGKSPAGMAFNSAGDLLFVANYCSKTLSVIDAVHNVVLPQVLPTGDDKGNPLDLGVYDDGNGNYRVFVAKESFPGRVNCGGGLKNTGLDVAVFLVEMR